MYDISHLSAAPDTIIPLAQIAETRRVFPEAELGFELLVEAPNLLAGLERCAVAFADAGLELRHLRCSSNGRIACRLRDDGSADLERLAQDLSGPLARIESWTTVIGADARPA